MNAGLNHSSRILLGFAIIIITLLFSNSLFGQINHWETAVNNGDDRRYFIGTSSPNANWYLPFFNDATWPVAPGGIGWGDGDDSTVVTSAASVFMRVNFNVVDTAKILQALFNIDYQDGFIAWLNGVEIARGNLGDVVGDFPLYNESANITHEAEMRNEGMPEGFIIDKSVLSTVLKPGANLLAVQVHVSSGDLTSNLWLSFGISDASNDYGPNPSWFMEPFESSDLPIIHINTNGGTIKDNPRIQALMGIIYNGPGQRNNLSDPYNEYNGLIELEIRGSATQLFPKKSYSVETQTTLGNTFNVPLLGMPSENDWVLYAPYSDESLMRNYIMYERYRKMDHYGVRPNFVELVINNEYRGVYLFTEKIKRDKGRIDIPKLDPQDTVGDDITGGYVLKVDWGTGPGAVAWNSPYGNNSGFRFHDPKMSELGPVQEAYIQTAVTDFEDALFGPNSNDPELGYRPHIDTRSFIDFMCIQEITHNHDGYRASIYIHKGRDSKGGKIRMGPIWDFNMAMGNNPFCNADDTAGWEHDYNVTCNGVSWFPELTLNAHFQNAYSCRWLELREGLLHPDTINALIDSTVILLNESQERNFTRWPTLGKATPWNTWAGADYPEEVDFLKSYLASRGNWLDQNTPVPFPTCLESGHDQIGLTEVNYHSDNFGVAGDWIELHNASPFDVDLSDWLFKDGNPAQSFSIPPGTIIPADSYLVICEDTAMFSMVYPNVHNILGNFGFGLGNGGDGIHLFNEHHVEIVSMNYLDEIPWPLLPDGHGYTLEVVDPQANLNSPANWFEGCIYGSPGGPYDANCGPVSAGVQPRPSAGFTFFPNPFESETQLEISAGLLKAYPSLRLELRDVTGRLVKQIEGIKGSKKILLEDQPAGIYFATLSSNDTTIGTRKLITR